LAPELTFAAEMSALPLAATNTPAPALFSKTPPDTFAVP